MSYDIDNERYSVHPNEIWGCDEGAPCPIEIRWLVVDDYYEEVIADYATAQEADKHCTSLNHNYNEEQGMRAQEGAFEAYWGGDGRHASDRPATRDELIRDWDRD